MWTPDWLRRFRSGKIVSVELTGRHDAAIDDRQSTLEDANVKIVTHEDDNDFVVIYSDYCTQPSSPKKASHIETISIGARHQSSRQQLIKDCEQAFISRASAYSMELCGRGDHNHTFQDLRSATQAGKRDKTIRQKYYNFKYVKPGDVGAAHRQSAGISDTNFETLPTGNHSILTKAGLYRQAQLPPRPPKYRRRHIDKIYGTLSHRVDARRKARKHGKAIMEGHLRNL